MSDKKSLKQSRLPFQIISTSPKVVGEQKKPVAAENASPRAPVAVPSRKRKQSSDGDNTRLPKIGRTGSKENIISEPDTIEILDDSIGDELNHVKPSVNESDVSEKLETTPTTLKKQATEVRKIKIGRSCSKMKQIIKPAVDQDDSVVYLSEEELQSLQKSKKSVKKSEKKKPKSSTSSTKAASKNTFEDVKLISVAKEPMEVEDDMVFNDDDSMSGTEIEKRVEAAIRFETVKNQLEKCITDNALNGKELKVVLHKAIIPDDEDKIEGNGNQKECDNNISESFELNTKPAAETEKQKVSDEISKLVDKSIEDEESSVRELNDDIAEVLTDDEKKSPSNVNGSASKILKLTPKALARRKELESKRIEKELQRQKEKEEKEKQRLKEKELREEAKRKEREEKEELRRREKEEKDVSHCTNNCHYAYNTVSYKQIRKIRFFVQGKT